jgi:DNA (cytosine-5)-methyltransferase 1
MGNIICMSNSKVKKTYNIASLFSGCGGMDLGAEGGFVYLGKKYPRHNTRVVFAMDFDKPICEVYNKNFDIVCEHRDIRELQSKELPNHEILTGGFPCQSFSVVAQNPKRLGYKDDKGKLFFEMCRILKDRKPSIFVAENVKGLLSANSGEAFPLILQEFENAGYWVKYKILNASHYGVPQKRERVFIIGFRNKKAHDKFEFPEPITAENPVPLSAVLHPETEVDQKYFFSKKAVEGMKASKNSLLMNKGRIQDPSMPCNTVGAHLAKVSLNSTDPVLAIKGKYRMFTPREVARIQSFPDTFELTATKTINYKALGNAVAPVVMWHVMKQVIAAVEAIESDKLKRLARPVLMEMENG